MLILLCVFQHWRTMPNYSILVDTRDRLAPQITYVPQENLEIATKTQVRPLKIDSKVFLLLLIHLN